MSVLSCVRNGCTNIMCDTYVPSIGYICFDCQNDFKDYFNGKRSYVIGESDIIEELDNFIDTEKVTDMGNILTVDDFFKKYTE